MTIYDDVFPMGIGTNRFPIADISDKEGLEYSVSLMTSALDSGISYIDVGYSYSKGMAETICKLAFQRTKSAKNITIKSSFLVDQTSDDALRRIENSFKTMGIDHATYFVIWNIANEEQFNKIMSKGSLYDGAVKAKKERLIDHICFSSHASAPEIIKMIHSGAYEGATISFSALNCNAMQPILDCAEKKDVGIVVMNPLGGGIIPQNSEYFSYLCNKDEKNVAQAALRFVYAHPAVKVVLSGINSQDELIKNLLAFQNNCVESDEARLSRVYGHLKSLEGFCTGCRYCDGCPSGIKVYELMQAYNTLLLPKYSKTNDKRVAENQDICRSLKNTFSFIPNNGYNPCIKCRQCEGKCTAHLPIIKRINELYNRFDECGFTKEAMRNRIKELISDHSKIAFYPGGGYTAFVLSVLKETFLDTTFDISLFDSNSQIWGNIVAGIQVHDPSHIMEIKPQIIIISNYNYGDEIYKSLKYLKEQGIRVEKLHKSTDTPWVF